MKKLVLLSIICFIFASCSATIKEDQLIVRKAQESNIPKYYKYVYQVRSDGDLYVDMYSNKKYHVGDTIKTK